MRSTIERVLLVTALAFIGCGGGPPPGARTALGVVATSINAIDAPAAQALTHAHFAAFHSSTTREEYDRRMQPHFELETHLRLTLSTLLAIERAFDAWSA